MFARRWIVLLGVTLLLVVGVIVGWGHAAQVAGTTPASASPVVAAFPAETRAAEPYVYVEAIYLVHANGTIERQDAP